MLFTYLYISTCGFLMNAWFYKIYDIYHMDNQVIQNVPLQYGQKYWFSLSTFVHKSYIPIVHLQFFAFLNGLIHQNLFNEKKSFETVSNIVCALGSLNGLQFISSTGCFKVYNRKMSC